jgi:hypothetical protein
MSPSNAMELYNPREDQLADVYLMEKLGTQQIRDLMLIFVLFYC